MIDRLRGRPLPAVLVLAAALLGTSVLRAALNPGRPPLTRDAAFYGLVGWHVATRGAVPYVDAWSLKPPLVFETTALLAVLAGDVATLHRLAVALTVGAALAAVGLAGTLVARTTDDGPAGAVAAALLLSVPGFHRYAAWGFHPKYLVLALGLGGLHLALRDRPLAAGAAATASVALWQLGGVLAAAVAAASGRKRLRLIGAGAAGALVLAPVLAWGAATPMLVEAVLAPLATSETMAPGARVAKAAALFGPIAPIVAGGLLAAAIVGIRDRMPWLAVAAAGASAQLVLDLDWYPDLFLPGAVAAVGAGIAIARIPALRRRQGAVAAIVGIGLLWSLRHGPVVPAVMGERYWSTAAFEACHVHLGGTERRWLDLTGRTIADPCGSLPDDPIGLLVGDG